MTTMHAVTNLHFGSMEQIQNLQRVLAHQPWWFLTIFHLSSPTNFVCNRCHYLALPHYGKLLSIRLKIVHWSSPWQIWGDAQVVRNKVIPRICQGTVQYSRSYRFRQIYRLLSPNFLCTAVTNSTGQRIVKYRETDAILEKMSTMAEGSEPLSDYRWTAFRELFGEEFILWYSTRLNFDQG